MTDNKRRWVGIWLMTGVVMIIVQILLGGVTRLTGSGLSITEWKPIMGALPPLTEQDWLAAFRKYQELAQYKYLNSHFDLADFKFIFFWEWFHRVWARLLGVVFAIGFIFFLIKGYFDKKMIIPFIVLFILGGLQGLVGWIMVKSGLNESDLYVNHIKLAIHFISALVLLCYTLWFALKLLVADADRFHHPRLGKLTIAFIVLLGVQLFYGAFMAGLKAAPFAPTWPDMNGVFMPDTMGIESWINNPFNVQFLHRMLAYLLSAFTIFWFIRTKNLGTARFRKNRHYPLILVFLQVVLGIFTVLYAPKMGSQRFGIYEIIAQAHQLVAMFLLVSLFVNLFLMSGPKASAARF